MPNGFQCIANVRNGDAAGEPVAEQSHKEGGAGGGEKHGENFAPRRKRERGEVTQQGFQQVDSPFQHQKEGNVDQGKQSLLFEAPAASPEPERIIIAGAFQGAETGGFVSGVDGQRPVGELCLRDAEIAGLLVVENMNAGKRFLLEGVQMFKEIRKEAGFVAGIALANVADVVFHRVIIAQVDDGFCH